MPLKNNTNDIIKQLRKGGQKAIEAADEAIGREAGQVAVDAKKAAPKAFSLLTNSIQSKRVQLLHWQVFSGVQYAQFVEQGTKPSGNRKIGKNFHRSLQDWVKIKGIASGKQVPRVAYVIGKSIAKKGTEAQPFLEPSLDEKRMLSRIEKAIKNVIQT